MAQVFPFAGYRYNPDQVEDIDQVVTQPYDKINDLEQEKYYQASPYNIVRLILGKGEGAKDKYEMAANYLKDWVNDEVLIQDQEPGFYAYCQEYETESGTKTRIGFVGLGKIEGEEGVKAHEETLEGPKADRLNLIRATEANFGHIFMLYSDKERKIIKALDQVISERKPLISVTDKDQNLHKLWPIKDQELIDLIKEQMQDKKLYIADGHHRYQTALNYRNECRQKGYSGDFDKRMMTFVNINDPGLTILATHRLVYGLDDFDSAEFLEQVQEVFEVTEFANKEEMYHKLDQKGKHIFGYKSKDDNMYYTLTLKDDSIMDQLITEHSQKWRNLDVAILHQALLNKYLGIDEEALAEKRNLDYIRYRDQALDQLDTDDYQAAFILNPTQVEEVKEVADNGERMPQKSTDFYPKLLTGLVLHKLTVNKN